MLFALPFASLDENDWLKFYDNKYDPRNLPNHDLISFNVKNISQRLYKFAFRFCSSKNRFGKKAMHTYG